MPQSCIGLIALALRAVIVATMALVGQRRCVAIDSLFDFHGSILQSSPTFELPAPTGTFSGRVAFDSEDSAPYPLFGCNCSGSRQQQPNGFYATFGDMQVRADEYVMEVFDDLPQSSSQIADVVTFIFASDLDPALNGQLIVNDVPQPAAHFLLSFLWYGGNKFTSSDLADVGELTGFDSAVSLLGDTGRGQTADVFVNQVRIERTLAVESDFDDDNDVDGADFLIWQQTVGSTADLRADANRDGQVGGADLIQWEFQWGLQLAGSNANQIPEAPTYASLATGLLALLVIRVRRVGSRRRER